MTQRSIKPLLCLTALVMLLCACGKVGDLEPKTAQSVPPVAYAQQSPQKADALIKPSVQARPGRSDELLRRSESRTADPFDIPPGEDPAPLPAEKSATVPQTTPAPAASPKE